MVGTAVGAFSRALCATLNKIRRQAAPLLLSGLERGRKDVAKMPFSIYRCLGTGHLEKHLTAA